jgi:aminopeptidase
MNDFKRQLAAYAEVLVAHGLNVQPGQIVNISTEPYHRDFSLLVAEAAYKKGAKFVNIDLADPKALKLRIEHSKNEDLSYVPAYTTSKYSELVDTVAANLKILGPEEPDLLADLDPKKINIQRLHQRLAIQYFYDEGIGKSKVHWTVAAAATPKWGQKVFPNLNLTEAEAALWREIFSICRVDKSDYMREWREHNERLRHRAKRLTEMKIQTLHFKGPGTDLKVGLSNRALWKGGTDRSPRGVEFEPNIPTEESFTTPDFRVTEGKVRTTRPFLINGKLIEGLEVEFQKGMISSFKAKSGADTFKEYISSDIGAKRLGEVALVGTDSPIFRTGLVFEEILFDENAACHIAIGSAYKFCIENGSSLDSKEAESIGCNESNVHTDMMISSEEVDVFATDFAGRTIQLIRSGAWIDL